MTLNGRDADRSKRIGYEPSNLHPRLGPDYLNLNNLNFTPSGTMWVVL